MGLDPEVAQLIGGAPTPVAGEVALPALLESRRNPLWWGARTGRTRADITTAFQSAANWCRDNDTPFEFPVGSWQVGNLNIYTGGDCKGELVGINNEEAPPVVNVLPRPSDVVSLDEAFANSIAALTQVGANKDAVLAPYYGHTIAIATGDQKIINRRISGGSPDYREVIVVHDPDGSFLLPTTLPRTLTWTNVVAKATRNQPTVEINGLKVRLEAGTAALRGRYAGIQVSRPNTKFNGGGIVNEVGLMAQLFRAEATSGITLVAMHARGADELDTQYAFAFDQVLDYTLIGCTEAFCRRGLDTHMGKLGQVVGGSYPDGVGGHWIEGFDVGGNAFLASDLPNSAPIFVAGRDVSVHDCTILLRSDQFSVAAVRGDLFELAGKFDLSRNKIMLDCTPNPAVVDGPSTRRALFAADSSPPADPAPPHLWGRRVKLPSQITMHDNMIEQYGATYNKHIYLVDMLATTWPMPSPANQGGVEVGGSISIRGTQLTAQANLGDTPLRVDVNKPQHVLSGTGYDISIEDTKGVNVYLSCPAGHPNPSLARHNVTLRNVNTVLWQANYGAFRRARLDVVNKPIAFGSNRPSGGHTTPIGDEYEYRDGPPLFLASSWDPPNLAHGTSASQTFTVPGAAANDHVEVMFDSMPAGFLAAGSVTNPATSEVTATLANLSGSSLNIGNRGVHIRVFKR